MTTDKTLRFKDEMHEGTEDKFELEHDYKGRTYVRITQETFSGMTEVYLSYKDIEQIYNQIKGGK